MARTAQFLDDIKNLGYYMAFKGGLSFNLADVLIPPEKDELVQKGYDEVEQIMANYNMGFITNNERYNQIIDTWTHVNSNLSNILIKQLTADNDGFNSIYMMMDSGARGSKEMCIRDRSGIVHTSVGKVSFTPEQIRDNAKEFISTLIKLKPTAAKGAYIKSIYLSSTMSAGIKIDPKSVEEN